MRTMKRKKKMATGKEKRKERRKWFLEKEKKEEGKEKKRKKKERWGKNKMNGLQTSTYPKKGIKIMKLPIYPYVKKVITIFKF